MRTFDASGWKSENLFDDISKFDKIFKVRFLIEEIHRERILFLFYFLKKISLSPTFLLNSFNREARLRSMIGPANSEESRKQNDDPTTVSEQEIAEPSHAPKSAPESRFWNHHTLKGSLSKWWEDGI